MAIFFVSSPRQGDTAPQQIRRLDVSGNLLLSGAKAQASRRAAFPGRSRPTDADEAGHGGAVDQPGGSAGAKLVVEHDNAAGGVVRDVRAHRLALGGSTRCTQRGRIIEVRLEHAEIR